VEDEVSSWIVTCFSCFIRKGRFMRHVCVSVSLKAFKPLDGYLWNLIWESCHWRQFHNPTYYLLVTYHQW
jgi:hypothetical protein